MLKIVLVFLVGLIFVFQNCADSVNFAEAPSAREYINSQLSDNNGDNVELIKKICQRPRTKMKVPVFFKKPDTSCPWGENGNLEPKTLWGTPQAHPDGNLNDFFNARIEQVESLNISKDAVICDVKFDFKVQPFLYDDHILLLMNDHLIASSYDFSEDLQLGTNGLLKYKWQDIAGIPWDKTKEGMFCAKVDQKDSSRCSFPETDTDGQIILEYKPELIQSIMTAGVPDQHKFSFVTLGDNDDTRFNSSDNDDCEHSDLRFEVEVEFVL